MSSKAIASMAGGLTSLGSLIPGLGSILGGVGLAAQALSPLFAPSEDEIKRKWKERQMSQLAGIDAAYNASTGKAVAQATNTYDSAIGEASNNQGLAGSVAGLSGSGSGRLQASTLANLMAQKNQSISAIRNAMEQNRAAMKASAINRTAEGSYMEEASAPNTYTFATNIANALSQPTAQEGAAGIIGGLGYMGKAGFDWLSGLFSGKTYTPQKVSNVSKMDDLTTTAKKSPNPIAQSNPQINIGNTIPEGAEWIMNTVDALFPTQPLNLRNMLSSPDNFQGNLFKRILDNNYLSLPRVGLKYQQKLWGY